MHENGFYGKMWIKNRLSTFLVGMMWITLTLREIKNTKNQGKIGLNP